MRTNRPTTAAEDMGLGPKKTFLVLFTVVGCIAILFPKIFYPMLMGPAAVKDNTRPLGKIVNRERHDRKLFNTFFEFTDLLKQERPVHITEMVYPGMQERGRAIPPHSVPIIERPGRPGGLPPRPGVVERRVRIFIVKS